MTVSAREHARLARELIAACGGLDEATANCRVSKSKLSDYQNPATSLFMPADVMACLEEYSGQPLYSGALFGRFDQPTVPVEALASLACDASEASLTLQRGVRCALADGALSPRERDAISSMSREAKAAVERVEAAISAADSSAVVLRAV